MLTHYFSCSGGPGAIFIKSSMGHVMSNLCFCIRWDLQGYIVHYSASGLRNVDTLFFMLGWARYRFDKKHTGTHDAELVFLYPLGSAGHVAQSGVSGA
jgi:hypothetical protein